MQFKLKKGRKNNIIDFNIRSIVVALRKPYRILLIRAESEVSILRVSQSFPFLRSSREFGSNIKIEKRVHLV